MLNHWTLVVGIYVLGALISLHSHAQSEFEVSCRTKAKESASEVYRSCMTEQRAAQVEQIKREYQDKLNSLKDEYEREIEKLGGKTKSKKVGGKNSSHSNKKMTVKKNSVKSEPKLDLAPSFETRSSSGMNSSTNSGAESDDSVMDLPEPIPVESIPGESTM